MSIFGTKKSDEDIREEMPAEGEIHAEEYFPVKKMELNVPIMINNREFKEIEYNFDALNTKDLSGATKLMSQYDMIKLTPQELDHDYHFFLFVKAVQKVNPAIACSDLMRMNAKDGLQARSLARKFFFLSTEDSSQTNS